MLMKKMLTHKSWIFHLVSENKKCTTIQYTDLLKVRFQTPNCSKITELCEKFCDITIFLSEFSLINRESAVLGRLLASCLCCCSTKLSKRSLKILLTPLSSLIVRHLLRKWGPFWGRLLGVQRRLRALLELAGKKRISFNSWLR